MAPAREQASPIADLRQALSDLADSATRGATGRAKGLEAEMAVINPAYARGLAALADVERDLEHAYTYYRETSEGRP